LFWEHWEAIGAEWDWDTKSDTRKNAEEWEWGGLGDEIDLIGIVVMFGVWKSFKFHIIVVGCMGWIKVW
jgi:hypothetical protein